MEHSATFVTKDGTEYKLSYDNESGTGKEMHYLLHENGVLKLECHHHAVPETWGEDEFKSAVIPLAFLNCLGRTMNDLMVKHMAENSGDPDAAVLAQLVRPHVALDAAQVEYVESIANRGHSVELFVQLNQELEVERFAQQLNAEVVDGRVVDIRDIVAKRTLPAWVLPTLWSAGVVVVTVLAVFGGKLFGLE